MPALTPSGGPVSWPIHEGTLGVVGVAPWATLEFMRCFYELITVKKDWNYPRVLLDINCKLPSRGRHLQLGEEDPSPYIAATISELAAAGATVAIVACNTAHILYSRWASCSPIPIINIIDASIEEACLANPTKVLVLASSALATSGLYEERAMASSLVCISLPSVLQKSIAELIDNVKTRVPIMPEADKRLRDLINFLFEHDIDTVILGCTELSILSARLEAAGFLVIDSNKALAKAAYSAIMV